ncbi:MAG: ribonuclease H family protein [Muribaculaceae bacterium]
MANNFKWYVVWAGNAPGIYDSWEECKIQVENVPGARYKSYNSKEQAILAYRGDPKEQMQILRNIANSKPANANYDANENIMTPSLAVDAACSGNPGAMEYQGVLVSTCEVVFRKGPYQVGTNNIGEFLALVHGLALLKQKGSQIPIYSDSSIAIKWIREKKCKTKLEPSAKNAELFAIVARAEAWLKNNTFTTRVLKWETKEWGEIPADFGRK